MLQLLLKSNIRQIQEDRHRLIMLMMRRSPQLLHNALNLPVFLIKLIIQLLKFGIKE